MAEMTMAEMKEAAKKQVLAKLTDTFETLGAENYKGDYHVAVPTEINGQEIWVKLDMTAAQFKDTKVSPAFDPFESQREYLEEQEVKAKEKAAKDKAKAEKIARDTARRASKSKTAE